VPRFELSKRAEVDIDDIAAYTARRWGSDQVQAYLRALEDRFEQLARRPLVGRPRKELGSNLRSFPFQSHVIYYERAGFGVWIVRVLHQRQEAARHLKRS
jgi:toxin ParE1/3/4